MNEEQSRIDLLTKTLEIREEVERIQNQIFERGGEVVVALALTKSNPALQVIDFKGLVFTLAEASAMLKTQQEILSGVVELILKKSDETVDNAQENPTL